MKSAARPAEHARASCCAADPRCRTRPADAPSRQPAHPQTARQDHHSTRGGDPNGEICTAWVVAQRLTAAYASPDPARRQDRPGEGHQHRQNLPHSREQPLRSTLTARRTEFLALPQPQDREHQEGSERLPVLRHRLRPLLNYALNREDQQTAGSHPTGPKQDCAEAPFRSDRAITTNRTSALRRPTERAPSGRPPGGRQSRSCGEQKFDGSAGAAAVVS